jgi:hypothetical protein
MASDVDERARVLCLGLSLQSGTDDSDAGFAHVVTAIAAAMREHGAAEYERGVLDERARWGEELDTLWQWCAEEIDAAAKADDASGVQHWSSVREEVFNFARTMCSRQADANAAALRAAHEAGRLERDTELARVADALAGEFERAVAHAEWRAAGSKGMGVPFHGDFEAIARMPSAVGKMRWWARELRKALLAAPDAGDK